MPNDLQDWTRSFQGAVSGEVTVGDLAVQGLLGAQLASRYVGAVSGAAPASGTFNVGDFVVDRLGGFWVCVTAGSPGTWVWVPSLATSGDLVLPSSGRGSGNLSLSGTVTPTGAGAVLPLRGDLEAFTSGGQRTVQVDNDSSSAFGSANLMLRHTAGALPNAGHEKWVLRSTRPGAGGVASNTRFQLYRANPAESTLQEYLRIDENGFLRLADSTLVVTGTPNPGRAGVRIGDPATFDGHVNVPTSVGGTPAGGGFGTVPLKQGEVGPLGAAAATMALSGIPSGFRKLRGEIYARGDSVANNVDVLLTINSDSGTNYDQELGFFAGTSGTQTVNALDGTGVTAANVGFIPAANAPANAFGTIRFEIQLYANTVGDKTIWSVSAMANAYALNGKFVKWDVNFWHPATPAAITALSLGPSAGNFATGSWFGLYLDP